MKRFENRVALVTGAARGIGRGIALKLASEGANVVVNDFGNMDAAQAVVTEIQGLGSQAIAISADVSDRDAVAELFKAAIPHFGRLDIVVPNAAVSIRQLVVEADWANVQRMIEVIQFGVFHVCQMAAQQMIKQEMIQQEMPKQAISERSRGKIAIIGSILGEFSAPTSAPYNMSKAAINNFAKTLAAELSAQRINVNIVNPGWIDTPGERVFSTEEEIAAAGPAMPWGRLGQPEDIANAIAFLCSDEADYITGAALRVDGGYMANLSLSLPVGSL